MVFDIQDSAHFGRVLGWISDAASRKVEMALSVVLIFLTWRTIRYYQGLKATRNHPGPRVGFHALSLFGHVLLPRTWWNPQILFAWYERLKVYKQYGTDTICFVPFFSGSPIFYTSNLEVARQILADGPGASFVKPHIGGAALRLFGPNVFSSNGVVWRTHRRIVGPSFNNTLYKHVFDESVALYHDMTTSEKWTNRNDVHIPAFQTLTYKFALLVIEKCGFGIPFKWSAPPDASDGSMSLQKAIEVVNSSTTLMIFAPWVTSLPLAKFRNLRAAFRQVMSFMEIQVDERRALVQNSKGADLGRDAFTALVQANEDEAAKYKLDKQELIGNVYALLIAGHESTATSLATTVAYLALYPDIQNELVEQIESVVGYGRDPVWEDYHQLNKVLSAFLEAIRMIPPAPIMIRESAEDTVLKIPKPIGQEGYTLLPISKGTLVTADVIGLGYNPRYYDEPEVYKPSRWYATENVESELFSGFSVGTRNCIGRKFAVTEAVAFLTMLLRDWRVEPLMKTGESKDEWRKRAFEIRLALMLGIKAAAVKLVRRHQQS